MKDKWGSKANVTLYASVGSGLDFSRPAILRLISDLLDGKYKGGFVVATDFTRIARFGIALVEHIAKLGGAQIIYTLDDRENKSENETMVDDVLAILTSYANRQSSKKAGKILSVKVSPEVLNRVFILHRTGYSIRTIANILENEGLSIGECGRKITRVVIRRLLIQNRNAIDKLTDDSPAFAPTNFHEFCKARLRLTSPQANASFKAIQSAYLAWCKENDHTPITSHRQLSHTITSLFPTVQQTRSGNGSRLYCGLSLLK